MKISFSFSFQVFVLSFLLVAADVRAEKPLVSHHRGASRYAPENTAAAFDQSIALGADYIEFDVRTSRDGKFFLLHDARLDRTTDGTGLISDTDSETISRLDAGEWFGAEFTGERVLPLDEFIERYKGKVNFYFDAKAILPDALAAALERHGVIDSTVVFQSPEYLLRLKEIDPRIRRMPPLKNELDIEKLAAELNPYAFDASWTILSSELIERCHALGIKVFSDALGEYEKIEEYRKAINWGIDLIQTDNLLGVQQAIKAASAERK